MHYVIAFLFFYLSPVIFYVIGFLRLGCTLIVICFKLGGESLRQFQRFRRVFRRVLCVMWRKISSQSSCSNHEILFLDLAIWVVDCGLLQWAGKFKGFFRRAFYGASMLCGISQSPDQIFGKNRVPTTTLAVASITPNRSRTSIIFFVCGADRITYLVLIFMCMVNMLVFAAIVLDLLVLGLVLKRKTTAARSRSSFSSSITSTVTTSSKPSQPDSLFWYKHLKTDIDHHRYLRHFGYRLRHYGYFWDTVTISWVIATLIALGSLNLKNSSSCYSHVLKNIWLDLFRSLPCALTHTDFIFKINVSLHVVWSSPLREKKVFWSYF